MKIKSIHFDVEKLLHPFRNIDFSLFLETIPEKNEELSSINIISLHEPNEYFKTNSFDSYTKLPDNGRIVKMYNSI